MEYDYFITSRVANSPVSFDVVVSIFRVPHNAIIADRQTEVRVPANTFEELGKEEVLSRLYKVFWQDLTDSELNGKRHLIPVSLIVPELEDNIEQVLKCKQMMAEAASRSEEEDENEDEATDDDVTTEDKPE